MGMAIRLRPADEVMDRELSRAQTLPKAWYLDEAMLVRERDRLFGRTWQWAGRSADVAEPGQYVTLEVAGEPILVTRDEAGELRAFYNVCRHRAGPPARGSGRRRAFQCAYHGWTYGLDGRLLTAREMEGVENFACAEFGLVPVRADVWGPLLFVNLDAEAEPLEAALRPIRREVEAAGIDLGAMRSARRRDYDIACNWKVYVDNYLEGYHIPFVHPGLFKELDYDRYEVCTFQGYSKQFAPIRPAVPGGGERAYGRYVAAEAGTARPAEEPVALYYWLFPNLMLNVYPDNVSANLIVPTALGRTLTIFEWFTAPGLPVADVEATVAFSDEIQQEDIRICEDVQRGLASRAYERGRYSVRRENGVHHYHRLLAERLAEGESGA
jgi:choline monooxygenase